MLDKDVEILQGFSTPLVVIDYWTPDLTLNSILTDNADSAGSAVKYLMNHGHNKIGYIRGSERFVPFRDR